MHVKPYCKKNKKRNESLWLTLKVVPQEWGAVVVASSGEDYGGTRDGEVFFMIFSL